MGLDGATLLTRAVAALTPTYVVGMKTTLTWASEAAGGGNDDFPNPARARQPCGGNDDFPNPAEAHRRSFIHIYIAG